MRRQLLLSLILPFWLALPETGLPHASASTGIFDGPRIVAFRALPASVHAGEAVVLSWQIYGVESVDIQWVPQGNARPGMDRLASLPPTGELTLYPEESTIYVLEYRSGRSTLATSTTVQVK